MYQRYLLVLFNPYHKDVFFLGKVPNCEASKVVNYLIVLNMIILGAHKIFYCPLCQFCYIPRM